MESEGITAFPASSGHTPNMKICYLLPWYSPAAIGGTEIHLVNLAKKMAGAGHAVTIICPAKGPDTEYFSVQDLPVIATPCIMVDPPGPAAIGQAPPERLDEFRALLAELDPDILHFHCFWLKHIFYLEAAKEKRIHTVITLHLSSFSCLKNDLLFMDEQPCDGKVTVPKCTQCLQNHKTKGKLPAPGLFHFASHTLHSLRIDTGKSGKMGRLLSIPFQVQNMLDVFRRIDKATDIFITLSPWYKKVMLDNGFDSRKVKIIQAAPGRPRPAGEHKSNLRPAGQPLAPGDQLNTPAGDGGRPLAPGGLKIIFAGRQSYEKGFHLLLAAIASLPPARLRLSLFGKITEPAFGTQIASLKDKGYDIRQHGEIAHDELLDQMEEMDVLCLPSTSVEMAPLVIPESFSMGIPVIGSRLGGIADAIVDGKNGFTFTPGNAADLAEKIKRLIDDPSLLKTMKEYTLSSFESKDIVQLHTGIYSKLTTTTSI